MAFRLFYTDCKISAEYGFSVGDIGPLLTLLAVIYCNNVLEQINWTQCSVAYAKHCLRGAAEHPLGSMMKVEGLV